jgi:hypothetical protein
VEAHLFTALGYKPEDRGFDFLHCHLEFSIDIILGVDSASTRNKHYGIDPDGVKAAGA